MNKDLAGVSAIWRALFGVRDEASTALFVYFVVSCQRAAELSFAAAMGPSLETGAVFECCTVGELLRVCDSVSVMAVQEKCDEKGRP
jgi:hypothetical protein